MLQKEELEKLVGNLVKLQTEKKALTISKAVGGLLDTSLLRKKKVEIARLYTLLRQHLPSSEFKILRGSFFSVEHLNTKEKPLDVRNKAQVTKQKEKHK
jgi:ribosomal protein L29